MGGWMDGLVGRTMTDLGGVEGDLVLLLGSRVWGGCGEYVCGGGVRGSGGPGRP